MYGALDLATWRWSFRFRWLYIYNSKIAKSITVWLIYQAFGPSKVLERESIDRIWIVEEKIIVTQINSKET